MRGRVRLVADELGPERLHEGGGAHLADAEDPLDVAAREQGPVELFELADGVAEMARSHRGFAGTVQVLSARQPPGPRATACTGSRGRRRRGPRSAVQRACGRA